MTRLAPETLALEDMHPPEMPSSSSVGPVPPPPRHLHNISTKQLHHHPTSPLSSSPSSSLLLLSTSTTDPSLFSFDIVRKLNQEHLATIPPNPYSAISVAQHQQQQQSQQYTAAPNSAASSASVLQQQQQQSPSTTAEGSSNQIQLSQLRRASAPDIVHPHSPQPGPSGQREGLRTVPSRFNLSPNRSLSSHRRSLDDLAFRRLAHQSPNTSSEQAGQKDSNMTATLGYGTSDAFARRSTVVPQTRELYLHPSQIFSPDGNSNNDISGYFNSSLHVANNNNNTDGSGIDSTISLPPMLTLEEIMQPHVFAKAERRGHVDNMNTSFSDPVPGSSSFIGHPDFSNETQGPWYGAPVQTDSRGNVYSSYMSPGQQQGSFGTDLNGHGKTVSPSLQHAQDIMTFSERVAMPPMPIPAPGSRSPSSLSPDFKNREFSPSRPTSKDGPTSQRSDTSHDAQPQKRSGKLPASVTATLKNWLLEHTQHPYPTEEEKRALCSATSLTMNQVSNWFINARRRILPHLGNVAMSGNRKQLTRYNPPGPRRVFSQDPTQSYPPFHADNEGMYPQNALAMASARMRSHPYANYGPPQPGPMHGSLATYQYSNEPGPY